MLYCTQKIQMMRSKWLIFSFGTKRTRVNTGGTKVKHIDLHIRLVRWFHEQNLLRSAQTLPRQPRSIFDARKSPFVDCNVRMNTYRTSFITDIHRLNGTVDFSFEIVIVFDDRNVIRRYRLMKLIVSLILFILF